MTDLEIRAALTDQDAQIATVLGEARSEPVAGQVAVLQVIAERVRDPRWPATPKAVCLQAKQFSCWLSGTPNYARTMAIADRLAHGLERRDRDDTLILGARNLLGWIGRGAFGRVVPPGTNHYFRYDIPIPSWVGDAIPVAAIGPHVFFIL